MTGEIMAEEHMEERFSMQCKGAYIHVSRNLGTFTIPTLYQLFMKAMSQLDMSLKQYRLCVIFLRRNGMILFQVTGRRRHSIDLPQGRMEVPCTLTFRTNSVHQNAPEAYSFSTC